MSRSGFTESVRTLWIYSMHASATYHNPLSTLTRTVHKASNQHEELGSSCKTRDFADLSKLINWFKYDGHNPFDPERTLGCLIQGGVLISGRGSEHFTIYNQQGGGGVGTCLNI